MESRILASLIFSVLVSSVLSGAPYPDAFNDGSYCSSNAVRKISAAEQAKLLSSKFASLELNLTAFKDKNKLFTSSPLLAYSGSNKPADRCFANALSAGNQSAAANSLYYSYLIYVPTEDIQLNIQLVKQGLNQQYVSQVAFFGFYTNQTDYAIPIAEAGVPVGEDEKRDDGEERANYFRARDYTTNPSFYYKSYNPDYPTPCYLKEDGTPFVKAEALYCDNFVNDPCANFSNPVSYNFIKGMAYIFTIYAFNVTGRGMTAPDNFFFRLNRASVTYYEDFDDGVMPAGWTTNINPTTAPERKANSTWFVGDINTLSAKTGSSDVNYGYYSAEDMLPVGGVESIDHFLGLNPSVPCFANGSDCLHTQETVTTKLFDLTQVKAAELQFVCTYDRQYRTDTQNTLDWNLTIQYSFDNSNLWQTLIAAENFPKIPTGPGSAVWLEHAFDAGVTVGRMVQFRFLFNQTAKGISRYYGMDKFAIVTLQDGNSKYSQCSNPYGCTDAVCPVIGGIDKLGNQIYVKNAQRSFGCGYAPNNTKCSAYSTSCSSAVCLPTNASSQPDGCFLTQSNDICAAGQSSCETSYCNYTQGGCVYTSHDNMCASGAPSCADYKCAPHGSATPGCLYNYTGNNFALCNDHATCTSDTCNPLGTSGVDANGCSHSVIAGSCAVSSSTTNPFGNSQCVTSVCDPAHVNNTDNQVAVADRGSGCYSTLHVSSCTNFKPCQTPQCDFHQGCVYSKNDGFCKSAGADCVTGTCVGVSGDANGCSFILNDTYCSDNALCTTDKCTNTGAGTSGCSNTVIQNYCDNTEDVTETNYGNSTCVVSVCDPAKAQWANNSISPMFRQHGCYATKHVEKCTDYSASCETPTCDFTGGCVYAQNNATCQAGHSSCVAMQCVHKTGCQQIALNHSYCGDGYGCTSDVCADTGSGSGCSHTPMNSYCSNDAVGGTNYGNSTCVTAVCDPSKSGTAANAFVDSGSSGCFAKTNDNMCTEGSADCETQKCEFTKGCVYTQHNDSCAAGHSSCVVMQCVHKTGCQQLSLNDSYCNDGYGCTEDKCADTHVTGSSGCSHNPIDDYCTNDAVNGTRFGNSSCVSSVCDPSKSTDTFKSGCFQEKHVDMCNEGSAVCETQVCDYYAGCVYTQHNDTCQALVSSCVVTQCVHKTGCQQLSLNHTYCSDGYGCTTDVCSNQGANTVGCSNTPVDSYCSGYGNSQCVTSVCSPSGSQNGSNAFVDSGKSGCYATTNPSMCAQGATCEDTLCDYTAGCNYVQHDSACQANASSCITSVCVHMTGCDNSDNTTKSSMCSDGYSCTVDSCSNQGAGTTGCSNTAEDSYCSGLGSSCSITVCDPSSVNKSDNQYGLTQSGCYGTAHDELCTGATNCDTTVCSYTSGCNYTAHDDVCQKQASDCVVAVCKGAASGGYGCDFNNTSDSAKLCNDGFSCTIDTCHNNGANTTGCSSTPDNTTCYTSDPACSNGGSPFGNSQAYSSVCNPSMSQSASNAYNDTITKTGCYTVQHPEWCNKTSSCDTLSIDFCTGCHYTPDNSACQRNASSCVNAKCVSTVGCDFSDVTGSNYVSVCRSQAATCDVTTCSNKGPNDVDGGCTFVPHDELCTNAPSCVTPKCLTRNKCSYTDVTTKIQAGTACNYGAACDIPQCDRAATPSSDGCVFKPDDSYCQAKSSDCVVATCLGHEYANGSARGDQFGCTYDTSDKAEFCNDGYSCSTNLCNNTGIAGDSGCVTTLHDDRCMSSISAEAQECASSMCVADDSSTDSTGCVNITNANLCTGELTCNTPTCSVDTGCSYIQNDTFCSEGNPTCFNYTCFTRKYDSSRGSVSDWQLHDSTTGCFHRDTCDDSIYCTVDQCQSDSSCLYTPMNNRCKQAKGCTENVCTPDDADADADGCLYLVRCDDGIDCTVDECVNTTAGRDKCLHTIDMRLCDDNVDCTYEFKCDVNAKPLQFPTIVSKYDNVTGCIRFARNEFCDDNNPCTIDICETTNTTTIGGCRNYQVDCDDGIPCTADSCDPTDGHCVHDIIRGYCDDGFECTTDYCDLDIGQCVNAPNDRVCDDFHGLCQDGYCRPSLTNDSTGCFYRDRHDCNDGIACTVDSCDSVSGNCTHTADDTLCDDGGQCTRDSCDVFLGKCTNIPDSSLCSDGLSCTVDFCDCETGNCTFTQVDCSDEIHCTVDSCSETDGCLNQPDDNLCDDGVQCTVDSCNVALGRCTNYADNDFCEMNNSNKSVSWICEPPTKLTNYSDPHITGCVPVPKNCDDGIACTVDTADMVTGECIHTPVDSLCSDGSQCNSATCSATAGCLIAPNDTLCNDNLNCTADICNCNGTCEFKELYCNDEVSCTLDTCNEEKGGVCEFLPLDSFCDDSISCTEDLCNATRGCVNIAHDSYCEDQSECSFGYCSVGSGGCNYEWHDEMCDDRIQCTYDYCNGTGCVHETQDGLCDDGIRCTADTCTLEGCVYTPHNEWCDDNVNCTENVCNPEEGCVYQEQDSVCNDNVACTVDYCDKTKGCQYAPEDYLCSDGISCTKDSCDVVAGNCSNVPMDSWCSDDFACSTESCNPNAAPNTTGCSVNISGCPFAFVDELCLECTSARSQIVELIGSDGAASSLNFRVSGPNGEQRTGLSILPTGQVIIGGDRQTVPINSNEGVVIEQPLRLVPVTEESLGACNEIRRGTIRVIEVASPCGDRTCHTDTVVICSLGETYQWTPLN